MSVCHLLWSSAQSRFSKIRLHSNLSSFGYTRRWRS